MVLECISNVICHYSDGNLLIAEALTTAQEIVYKKILFWGQ